MAVTQMDFCTLGMFIIDDIYPSPSSVNQSPHLSIVGGAGTYSAIGARLLSPPPLSARVGWIVDCGSDFPPELRDVICSWTTGALLRERDGLTTKGWNGYGANDYRAFKYLTPKLRLTAEDLSPALLTSKSYHLICSPVRCIGLVQGILARRKAQDESLPRPLFIWEPVPDLCVPSEQQNTYEALKHVDVISPNHAELASIFAVPAATATGEVHRANIEACSRKLLSSLSNSTRSHAVVVRSGKDGCYVVANSDPEKQTWLPAYHAESQGSVVDPTGGGNGFLGGFAVGLVRTGDAVQAAAWGSVSASLCIEQVGVPVLEADQSHGERWNGNLVEERLVEYKQRCGLAA